MSRIVWRVLSLLAILALLLSAPAVTASAQTAPFCRAGETPQFLFGFALLKAQLGDIMGNPLECVHVNPTNGDALQQTTTGLSFYRASTNTPTFTDGYRHWANTPAGLLFWVGDAIDPPASAVLVNAPAGSAPATPPVTTAPGPTTPQAPPASTAPGTILFQDSMVDDRNGWGENPPRYQFRNGKLYIDGRNSSTFLGAVPDRAPLFDNFSYEATVQWVDGATNLDFGIIFRSTNEPNVRYRFGIDENGSWVLRKSSPDASGTVRTVPLIDWTRTTATKTALFAENALKVVCNGTHMDLYINDIKVGAFDDGTSLSGQIGVYIDAFQNAGPRAAFSNVIVRAL